MGGNEKCWKFKRIKISFQTLESKGIHLEIVTEKKRRNTQLKTFFSLVYIQ